MRSDFETITVSRHDDHILLVTLNRPEASNALNTRMGLDLMELFETLSIDLEGLRAVIIRRKTPCCRWPPPLTIVSDRA